MTFPLGVWCYAIATVASVISVAFLLVGAFPGAALGLIAAGGFGWFGWRIMHMRLSLFDDSAEIQQLLRKHTLARADISSFSAGNGGLTTFFTRTVIANLADRSIPIHAFMRSSLAYPIDLQAWVDELNAWLRRDPGFRCEGKRPIR